jgi:hypothetical protein
MNDVKIAKKLVNLQHSAKDRNISFNVSFRKMKQLMTRKTCYYTGTKFTDTIVRSIDRVDNDKGYFDNNIVVCTVKINSIKNDLTVKEISNLNNKINQFLNK